MDVRVDLGEEKIFGWSASPKEARRHWKMARKVVAMIEIEDQNIVADSNCGGPGAGGESRSTVGCDVVIVVLVRWPESRQW